MGSEVLRKRCERCDFCSILGDGRLYCNESERYAEEVDWWDCDFGSVTVEIDDEIIDSYCNIEEYKELVDDARKWREYVQHKKELGYDVDYSL